MELSEYQLWVNSICLSQKVAELNHYFSAEALKAALKNEPEDVKYHLSKIQHPKIKKRISSLIELYNKKDGIDRKFLTEVMNYHGSLLYGGKCEKCIIEELEDDEYELDVLPQKLPNSLDQI